MNCLRIILIFIMSVSFYSFSQASDTIDLIYEEMDSTYGRITFDSPVQKESIHNPKGIGHGAEAAHKSKMSQYINNNNFINKLKQRESALNKFRADAERSPISSGKRASQQRNLLKQYNSAAEKFINSDSRTFNPIPEDSHYLSFSDQLDSIDKISEGQGDISDLYVKVQSLIDRYHPTDYKEHVSEAEYSRMLEEYKFILTELKLKGVLNESGLLSFHNIVDPGIPLQSDPSTDEGKKLLNDFNHHLSTKNKTSSFCSEFNKYENVCAATSFKDQLVELALYKIDQKIAENSI